MPELLSPWAAAEAEAAGIDAGLEDKERSVQAQAGGQAAAAVQGSASGYILPDMVSLPQAPAARPDSASLSWQLTPSGRWDRRFKSADWKDPLDVDWNPLYELYNARLSGALKLQCRALRGLSLARGSRLTPARRLRNAP
jgi:hypothetical protein